MQGQYHMKVMRGDLDRGPHAVTRCGNVSVVHLQGILHTRDTTQVIKIIKHQAKTYNHRASKKQSVTKFPIPILKPLSKISSQLNQTLKSGVLFTYVPLEREIAVSI